MAVGSLSAALWLGSASVHGAPYGRDGMPVEFTQPDGTKLNLRVFGDDHYARTETADGYTVFFSPAAKAYCYATVSADETDLVSTGRMVGTCNPTTLGLARHLNVKPEVAHTRAREARRSWEAATGLRSRWEARKAFAAASSPEVRPDGSLAPKAPAFAPPATTTLGNKQGLTLLIDFSDAVATIPAAEVENYLNSDNYTSYGNNGSVKKYFQDVSNGRLTYTNVLVAYVRVPKPKSFYNNTGMDAGGQGNLLIKDALDTLKARPDYNTAILPTFDNLTLDGTNSAVAFNVFFAGANSGAWARGLWPHSWVLQNVGPQSLGNGKFVNKYQITNMGNELTIGTFCHENGHMLCDYPDIYDYDYDSTGGAGMFCLMNSGASGAAAEKNPTNVCAYLKYRSGWCDPFYVAPGGSMFGFADATRGMPFYNRVYVVEKPDTGPAGSASEYFIMEARHKSGRDQQLPGSGVAIWHVDELGNGDNQSVVPNTAHQNYEVTLEQADGRNDFQNNANDGDANDLFFLGNGTIGYNNTFTNTSRPNSKWWDGSVSNVDVNSFTAPAAAMKFNIGDPLDPNTIRVDSPNGGETRYHGVTYQIKWATNIPGTVRVELLKGGVTELVITPGMPNSGTLAWEVPNTLTPGNDYRIRVASIENAAPTATDTSNANFTIAGNPPQVTSPLTAYGVLGQPFTHQVTVNNNPTSVSITNLPPGLSVNASGLITGTLTSYGLNQGRFFTTITATNAYGTNVATLVILVDPTTMSLTEALDSPAMAWTTGGSSGWRSMVPAAGPSHDGVDSAQTRWIDHGQEAWIETTVSGPGTVGFWWKVSSEGSYDKLTLTVDGQPADGIPPVSGEVQWTQKSVTIGTGFHTLRWTYRKDNQTSLGQDTAWLDEVTFTAIPLVPEVRVDQPAGSQLADGTSTVNFGSVLTGSFAEREFLISSLGTDQLTVGTPTFSGPHAGDFSVVGPAPGSPLIPGDNTTFTVRFAPTAPGTHTTVMSIPNDDPDEAPFEINLTGTLTANQEFTGGSISIPTLGAANPNPSTVTVAGVSGTITAVKLKLNGLVCTPKDLDMYLKAPNGKFCAIMSDAGGETAVANYNVVCADSAAARMPSGEPVQSPGGISPNLIFKPSDFNNLGKYWAPADVTAGDTRPTGTEVFTLAELAATSPNGDWKLYITDDTTAGVAGSISSWVVEIVVANPEIVVEQPAGTSLTSGAAALDFSSVGYGSSATAVTVTVKNTGTGTLSGLAITKSGAAAGDFTVSAPGATSLATGASTTFTVNFTPTAIGNRSAVLQLANNDLDENPFLINLSGIGTGTPLQTWRQTTFGTPAATGSAADLADPDKDGLVNLVEYAFALNPLLGASRKVPEPVVSGSNLVLSFTRPPGVSGITYAAEWSPSLTSTSWLTVPNTGSGNNFIFSVPMAGQQKGFMRIRVSNP